jgi:predicted nucleotidyltransferase component of viral defense system
MDFAREFGLDPNVVEKDYALGWLLAGISQSKELGTNWVFKGGTCLKKCFFETFRFSEDLDFTLKDPAHLSETFLVGAFKEVTAWIYEASGIEMPEDTLRFEVFANVRGTSSAQGRIGYRGPMQRGSDLPRIKLDLTADELLVQSPIMLEVHHPYSDKPPGSIHIQCYTFEEVFAEKVRALGERERPRDLYDVVHLYRHESLNPDRRILLDTLEKKCQFKGIQVPTVLLLNSKPERLELESEWGNMLAHQLPVLPPFKQFWDELPGLFGWLHGASRKVLYQAPMDKEIDASWRPPAMAQAWHAGVPLEIIRFAAVNRLCVDLGYGGRRRLVEPYSLRRTTDGNLLLFGVKHRTGELRSYRVDRMQGAMVTQTSFFPRYMIELTDRGPISANRVERRTRTI